MSEALSPDPVEDPVAYQEHLLGLLGHDDPAEVQAATPAAWRTLLRRRPIAFASDRNRTSGPSWSAWDTPRMLRSCMPAATVGSSPTTSRR